MNFVRNAFDIREGAGSVFNFSVDRYSEYVEGGKCQRHPWQHGSCIFYLMAILPPLCLFYCFRLFVRVCFIPPGGNTGGFKTPCRGKTALCALV